MSLGEVRAAVAEAIQAAEQALGALAGAHAGIDAATAQVAATLRGSHHRKPAEALDRWKQASEEPRKATALLTDGAERARAYLASLA